MVEITKIKAELETNHDEINILMILTLLALLLASIMTPQDLCFYHIWKRLIKKIK
jgi:hypothetical protein